MTDMCDCVVTMHGSEEDLAACRALLASVTSPQDDTHRTAFHHLSENAEVERVFGWVYKLPDRESKVVWDGQTMWSPPEKALLNLSMRFPNATFELTFSVVPNDWEVWKIADGEFLSIMDGTFLTWGKATSPIYRWSIEISDLTKGEYDEVLRSLCRERLALRGDQRLFTDHHPFTIEAFLATTFPLIDLTVGFTPWTLCESEHIWRACHPLVGHETNEVDYPSVSREQDQRFRLVERHIELTDQELQIVAERTCRRFSDLKHPFRRYAAAYRLSRMRTRRSAAAVACVMPEMESKVALLAAIERIGAHLFDVPYSPTREELEAVIQQTVDETRRAELQEAIQNPKWAIGA